MEGAALDDRTLRRTAAMLVALAVVAERAVGRSLLVRWLVLCILRRAEAVAWEFVVEATETAWPIVDLPELPEDLLDAAALAAHLRALAAALGVVLAPEATVGPSDGRRAAPCRAKAALLHRLLAFAAPSGARPRPADTS
jgi:hypothetical protein